MLIGYARTSTTEQQAGLAAQERELTGHKVDRIFKEQTSATGPRKALDDAIDYLRDGDTLIVTRLDRLARSVADLLGITQRIEAKGASLRILNLNLDTSTATGTLMLNLVGSIAQFERELMLERQREGIAKAKAEGKFKGRKPTARAKASDVRKLAANGMTKAGIANELGIGVASVYRILAMKENGAAG